MSRAVILCPGRGSYTESTLRSLPDDSPHVATAEGLRQRFGLPSLLELDRAEKFKASEHLKPSNVSPLIFLISVLDAERAKAEHDVVAVGGNSLGWYTALAVAGVLTFEEGLHMVQTISLLQERHGDGGQILYPVVDDEWRPSAERRQAVAVALESARGRAFPSIDLGGVVVLAGTEEGLRALETSLPKARLGKNAYPFRLMQHGPYHTPLVEEVAVAARESLRDMHWRRPTIALIDGLGRTHTPQAARVAELGNYTLGAQLITPFDFATSVRVALREFAPERIVLPGPGNALGGVVGQCLVAEGWRGVSSKAEFEQIQASSFPVVESMRR